MLTDEELVGRLATLVRTNKMSRVLLSLVTVCEQAQENCRSLGNHELANDLEHLAVDIAHAYATSLETVGKYHTIESVLAEDEPYDDDKDDASVKMERSHDDE